MPPSEKNGECGFICRSPFAIRHLAAFSLVEVLVVVSLLSLIVLALMAVFSSTQRAFRAAVTQTGVLEGSRAAMELMARDLRTLTPSYGANDGSVNFSVVANPAPYAPLPQSLPGTYPVVYRTNLLNYFFMLGRQSTKWTATGYFVDAGSSSPLYPLYRFYAETNTTASPSTLYNLFTNQIGKAQFTSANMSHLIDGVVHLTVRAYDPSGNWISPTYNYTNLPNVSTNIASPPVGGEAQFFMFSNAVPASVEVALGVLEDPVLAHAQSLPFQSTAQSSYLAQQSGTVHLFRQHASIPNVDPTAYP